MKKNICRVGGQAVMEGVMMKSEAGLSTAVRANDGRIVTHYQPFKSKAKKGTILGFPFIRGVVAFIESLSTGMQTLTFSAKLYGEDIEEEPTKFERFLAEKLGKSVESVVIGFAVFLSIMLSLGLFFALPLLIGSLVFGAEKMLGRSLFEGFVRLLIFLGYIIAISFVKDIKRVFMYHGAEHKTIACYEAGDDLNPKTVMKYSRLHPRCGTNYLFLVMAVSILFFTAIDFIFPMNLTGVVAFLARFGTRVLFLPLVAGISYEVLMLASKGDSIFAKIVRAPGMLLQLLTTKEPEESMIEVALVSFKLAMESIGSDVEITGLPEYSEYNEETEDRENKADETDESADGAVDGE
ncbi:MAG TPA: DUF1385 domain-containing protein [Clostridiales bacterium]|jgi:uncharacterized protein YqhQ|nr:DUF1385 domain-containing protein [Clostridiales bacterium]